MDKENKIILVTGATGQQGGAVARHLLKSGWKVRAVTRDVNKPSAEELKKLGAEITGGNMNSADDLRKAMKGVYGVFSVQNFWEHGYDGELLQGKNVADAAKSEGVKHILYSSVGGAERQTKLPHFDVKFEIEKYIKSLGITYTIIRPVFFMDNMSGWNKPAEENGKLTLTMALKPDTKLQMIAVDDIGAFAAIIFDNPTKYAGKEIEIAGDELSMPDAAGVYQKITGKETKFNELPVDALRANNEELGSMFQWFIDHGYKADIKKLKEMYPGLTSFESWLSKQ